MIELKNIHKSFGERKILSGLNAQIPRQSFTTLFGPNGCGKSTLMNILTGLDTPDSGEVRGFNPKANRVGFVFQDYRRSLLPWLTVEENILFPLKIKGVSKGAAHKALEELMATVGVQVDLTQRVYTLSGGQAQTVCLLRGLIIQPELLILDEPFSALDYERTLSLRQIVMDAAAALKLTVLFISHDIEEALYLGDQVLFLSRPPTTVSAVVPVSFSRPREISLLGSPEFSRLKLEALEHFQRALL